jgi:hypothetical protein
MRNWLDLNKHASLFLSDSNSSVKFMHGIRVLMAKNYIDNLGEETKKGMREKAEQGIHSSAAPVGYRNVAGSRDKRTIEPDPESAPIIQRLFEWYATGNYSLRDLTKKAYEDGLRSRTGTKMARSSIHAMISNPIYYGDFVWTGKRYRGIHEPLITKDLFDRAQDVLTDKGQRRTHQQKHDWAFQGLVSCGHCGCAYVAELKKKRYVYYHCTGNKGKCPEKYVREEEIARQFGEALRAIQLDDEVFSWIVTALKESHKDAKQYHDERVGTLQKQYHKLQSRLDKMYVDKLDGGISQEQYDRMSESFRSEQDDLLRQIEKHQHANQAYLDEGVRLLELSQNVVFLYDKQEIREKRRLLNFVCSNSQWKDGALIPNYRKTL